MATAAIAENSRAVIGDNNPPIPDQARMAIDEALNPLDAKATELIGQAEAITVVETEEVCEEAIEIAKKLRVQHDNAEERRKAVKAPYLEAEKIVDAEANRFKANLKREELRLGSLIHPYQEKLRLAEVGRQRQAEAALREAEKAREAQRASAGSIDEVPAEPAYVPQHKPQSVGVKSASGARTVSQTVRTITVTDPYALSKDILTDPKVTEALVSVINARLRANPDMKRRGFTVTESSRTVIR
jgi:hypothetical protein